MITELRLPSWYPQGVNHVIDLENDPAPYGEPAPEVMSVIDRRLTHSPANIVDTAGGYGRYAVPLASKGHNVTIVDIDPAHLSAAKRNATQLPKDAGEITVVNADITDDKSMSKLGESYDLSLNLAFLYLAPPEIASSIFKRYASIHRVGGLAIVQFSTEIERRDMQGNVLVGSDEYSYSHDEGREVLENMFHTAGFGALEIESFTIHDEEPYYLHADVMIASGVKES